MCSVRGVSTAARLRSWQTFVLPLVTASMLAPGSVSFGQPAAELRAKMEAAIIATEAALVSEETRLDELAEHNVDRTLEDGTPSVGQASSNIRLWEQRIREFEAGELELREALNVALVSLDSDIKQLAQRLSVQREHVIAVFAWLYGMPAIGKSALIIQCRSRPDTRTKTVISNR